MTTDNEQKIQKMLTLHKQGTVFLASWLEGASISRDLQAYYRRSGWLKAIGTGAFIRPNDTVTWQSGLYALANIGAMTALAMQGMAHYIRMGRETNYLFAPLKTPYPTWFKNHEWGTDIQFVCTSMLSEELGMKEHQEKTFSLRISSPERAILECLYLAPEKMDLVECYQVMEGLTTLRPALLQQLLEQCHSIKVKRLFLYIAKKAGHDWFKRLNTEKLELGTGSRTITKGIYNSEFGITVPEELHKL